VQLAVEELNRILFERRRMDHAITESDARLALGGVLLAAGRSCGFAAS
jgi:hypothetical protein